MTRTTLLLSLLSLCFVNIGCSHYRGSVALDSSFRRGVMNDLAVAGILDRRSAPVVSSRATQLLVENARASDASAQLDADDLSLLLSPPAQLAINAMGLRKLRERLGHRYLLVGEQGTAPVDTVTIWNSLIVIPAPYVTVWFTVPATVSKESDVPFATRILRVVDLESALILSESTEVLLERPDEGEFTAGQVYGGLSAMNVSAE